LLYETATFIGVNITALVRYLGQHGVCQVVTQGDRRRLLATPQLFGGLE
jgi:hypothetical protein